MQTHKSLRSHVDCTYTFLMTTNLLW